MDVFGFLKPLGEANALFVDEVLRPRVEDALNELRQFRLLPLVFVLLVERAADHGIDAILALVPGGREVEA